MSSSFRFGMGLEGEICWGPFPWWLVSHKLEASGGLSPTNWRHFFLFAINHGKCSSTNAYKLAFYEEKRIIPKKKKPPTIPLF